jgi:hypothetical protein
LHTGKSTRSVRAFMLPETKKAPMVVEAFFMAAL